MNFYNRRRGWTVWLMGALVAFSFMALAAADNTPQIGRYQMEVAQRHSFTDIYVIDTVTGVVKYLGKDEGKPFADIRGK